MTHIYDWLEMPSKNESEKKVKEYLDFRTRSAMYQIENKQPSFDVFCEYKNKKYKITGASRMGDVWLAKDLNRDSGYDERVDIEDCYNFSYINKGDTQ